MSIGNLGVTGVTTAQTMVKVHSTNMINAKTNGFKKYDVQTADLFYINLKKAGILENSEASKRPVGVQVGTGTQVVATNRNLKQGDLKQTNQPLDIAIKGPGYFAIALPNGRTAYTRDGSFKRDGEGRITTYAGNLLASAITVQSNIPESSIVISDDGRVFAPNPDIPGASIELGQLELFNFSNEKGLEAIGNNMLEANEASGEAIAIDITDKFIQKFVEESNVVPVEELTGLVDAQRLQEMCTRIIRVADEMEKDAIK